MKAMSTDSADKRCRSMKFIRKKKINHQKTLKKETRERKKTRIAKT